LIEATPTGYLRRAASYSAGLAAHLTHPVIAGGRLTWGINVDLRNDPREKKDCCEQAFRVQTLASKFPVNGLGPMEKRETKAANTEQQSRSLYHLAVAGGSLFDVI
jgi:hypothetical protein